MKKHLFLLCLLVVSLKGFSQSPPAPLVWGSTAFQDSIWAFDTLTWAPVINVPTQGAGATVSGINGLAYDPTTYKTFAILKMSGSRYLSEISLPSGSCNVIGDLGDNFSSITFDKFGQLYGSTGDGATNPESLYKIDKTSATSTLVFAMGNGADGEIICYNRFDDKMYHWSGNSSMVFESWPVTATTYSPTNITLSGSFSGETFGALNLSANHFLISNISSEFKYASVTGLYGNALNSNPDDIRGMIMPPQFSLNTATLCANSGTLDVYSSSLQLYDSVYYYWGDGNVTQLLATTAGTAMHTYTAAGTHTLQLKLYNGAVAKSTFRTYTITVINSPIVSISGSPYLCPGGTVTLTASGGGSSQWYAGGVAVPGATLNTFTTTTIGWYNMIKTNLNGCSDSAAVGVFVSVAPAPVIAVTNQSICAGNSATITPVGAAATYTISGGSFVVNPVSTSTYSIVGSSTAGCLSNTVVATVSVSALPNLTLSSSSSVICVGESATLTASGASTFSWNTNETSSLIAVSPSANATYTASGTSSEGCTGSNTISLLVSECTALAEASMQNADIRVLPNPGNGLFKIHNLPLNAELVIYNSLGQKIIEMRVVSNNMEADLSQHQAGLYIVRVTHHGTRIYDRRIIKN